MSGPLTDEQITEIKARIERGREGSVFAWRPTIEDMAVLLAEVERLKAERDEQAARMESAEQAFIDMAQNNGGFDACATLSHVTRIMSALRGHDTPHRVAYNQLHNEIARLKAERRRAIDALNEPGRNAVATSGDLEDGINMDSAVRNYELPAWADVHDVLAEHRNSAMTAATLTDLVMELFGGKPC